mmetsp:Transcript_90565/g.170697  ORF Transcript_90565/g.170697 Transcript_90565/m.170697 type:complete len:218 (-) Transcript_90565:32-685(-)
MAPQVFWRPSQRELPSLRRGWRTPDPSPTRDAAGLPGYALELCVVEDTLGKDYDSSSRGRSFTNSTHCTSRTPSPSDSPWKYPSHRGWWYPAADDTVTDGDKVTPRMQSTQPESDSMPDETPQEQGKYMQQETGVAGGWPNKDGNSQVPEKGDQLCVPAGSVGSDGHPYTCAIACKFVKKKSGCKDGVNCIRCHLCVWTRAVARENGARSTQPEKLG